MSGKQAKKIRAIVLLDNNKISRRAYKRAKKIYSKTREDVKPIFLRMLEKLYTEEKS
jgi:hypothetical protein